ncbi:MAG: hypothetical protein ACKVS5_13555 [Parvularculaceae bacterium]
MRILAFALSVAALTNPAFAQEAAKTRAHQLQLGLGFSAPWNLEEPYLNMAQTRGAGWEFEGAGKLRIEPSEALADGMLDPETWMPTKKAASAKFGAVAQFFSKSGDYRAFMADEWVIDWKGDARGFMQRWDGRGNPERTDNSVTYSLTPDTFSHGFLRFSQIGEGLSDIRLYRKKNAERLARGEIWNPVFLDHARRYDILRTMDIQSTNNIQVRRFDQIAALSEPWGQRATTSWPEPPFFSAPYEILFDLGVRTGSKIWLTIPPQLGAPISWADPSLRRKDRPDRLDGALFTETVRKHAKKTLASEEWDVFARAVADRLLASGYPLDRPLYVELGNEMWNNAAGFFVSTAYARGVGKAFDPEWRVGHGYGALSARMVLAFEREFARRKVRPRIIYVLATHTANPTRTRDAFVGFSAFLIGEGEDPKKYLAMTGVAGTNYFGKFEDLTTLMFGKTPEDAALARWLAAIKADPKALEEKVAGHLTRGPASAKATGPWIAAQWRQHQKIALEAGSAFLGGYEGGSHLNLPGPLAASPEFMAWWRPFHWGEEGAGVARSINAQLIEAFPGAIISNYASIGPLNGAAPWMDGHYAARTPMMRMWEEFSRPAR